MEVRWEPLDGGGRFFHTRSGRTTPRSRRDRPPAPAAVPCQRLPVAGLKLHSSVGSAAGAPGLKKAESWMCEVVK